MTGPVTPARTPLIAVIAGCDRTSPAYGELVLGDLVIHFPVTDFAISLLAAAAFMDVLSRVLAKPQWQVAVTCLLYMGTLGALAAVTSGLWLVSVQRHPQDDLLSLHHWFAYATLGAAAIGVTSRSLQSRVSWLSALRTASLLVAAMLVLCAGYVGGTMAHSRRGGGHGHTHDHGRRGEPPPEVLVPEAPSVGSDGSDVQP